MANGNQRPWDDYDDGNKMTGSMKKDLETSTATTPYNKQGDLYKRLRVNREALTKSGGT